MPGETTKFKVPYALGTDKPPSVPTITKAMAERVAAIFASFKGDATLAEDGTIAVGAKKILATMIADALKPSGGATAGTEALRALGTSSSTAAAGNDARLSDERTPKQGSATSAKWNPTAGTIAGEGAEEPYGSVLPKLIAPGKLLTPTVASRLFCWVNAYWWQEGEKGLRVGVRVSEVGKVSGNDFQAPIFAINPAISASFHWASFCVIAEVPAAEREIHMTFQPQQVGGGSSWKVMGSNWSMAYLLSA